MQGDKLKLKNIFEFDKDKSGEGREIFEAIASGEGEFKVERIISTGQVTPNEEVYDQDKDELVFLVEGEARLLFVEDDREIILNKGSYVFIKAHCKHKVTYTSKEPPCVWIAIHGSLNME